MTCAPTATRTRGLLLRRHFGSVARRCRASSDVPFRWSDGGWTWPGVARCLRSLAPVWLPPDLVNNANVRTIGDLMRSQGRVRRGCHSDTQGQGNRLGCRSVASPTGSDVRAIRARMRILLGPVGPIQGVAAGHLSRHPRGFRVEMRRRYRRGSVASWRVAAISSTWSSSPAATFITRS